MAKAKASILNNIRTAMAMAVPVPPSTPNPTSYHTLFRIRPYLFSYSSLSSNHPKDPNLIDDIKEGEGVFRFDPADGEPEMTPTRKGDTSHKKHQWNAATDGGPEMAPNRKHQRNVNTTHVTNKDMGNTRVGDMAKGGAVKAMETGINMGDMAKQTIDNVWDAAKETTHKIKEAVAGDDELEKKGFDVPASDGRVDLRKKAGGGYDLRNPPH